MARRVKAYNSTTKVALVDTPYPLHYLPTAGDTWKLFTAVTDSVTSDKRQTINPALHLLDYMTNDRFGAGLDVDTEIDLDSFKAAALKCDQRSNILMAATSAPTVGHIYTYPDTNIDGYTSGDLIWRGTVGAVSAANIYATTGIFVGGDAVATSADIQAVSALASANAAAITSINTVVANVSALTSVNAAAITSINTVVANVSALTSVNTAAITSINTVVAAVSALTSVNAAAITSINTVVEAVSALTSVNTAAITSINTVITDLSATFATSIDNRTAAITSVNTVITNLSATMATSIANHLPLAGGTLTGTVSGTDFYVSAVAIGVDALLGKELRIGTAAVADIVSLTDAANIAVDFNTGQNFAITLAGNRTLDNPTNCVAGQVGSIFIVQDGTGTRTLAFGSNWGFPDGTAPVISTSINSVDRLDYIVRTSTDVHSLVTKAYS